MADELFEKFYQHYPRKVARGAAKKAFEKLDPSEELVGDMIRAIGAQIRYRREMELAQQFVADWKHPATWIRAECWEDELASVVDIRAKSEKAKVKLKCECGAIAFLSAQRSPTGKPACVKCYYEKRDAGR